MGELAAVEEPLQARVLSRPAEAPLIWEALSAGYRRTCRMPDAVVCLNTWLHFDPDNVHAYFLRGEIYRQVGAIGRGAMTINGCLSWTLAMIRHGDCWHVVS